MSETSVLVGAALDAFDASLRLQNRANTARTYRSALKPLRALDCHVSELTSAMIRELAADKLRRGTTANSLRCYIAIYASFGAFCVEEGWRLTNCAAGIRKPRHEKVLRRYLTPTQARSVRKRPSQG